MSAPQQPKPCSRCGRERDREGQRYCRACHNAYKRELRRDGRLSELSIKRQNCRNATGVYVKRGVLRKSPCEVCGSSNVEAHHPDYDQPKLVRWLCRVHHEATHKGLRDE
jgi:hypothetical protein